MRILCALAAIYLLTQTGLGESGGRDGKTSITNAQTETKHDAHDFTVVLEGMLGKSGIEMSLTRRGEDLSGSYSYAGTEIDIGFTGNIDSKNNVIIQETDKDGKQTGIFKGRLESRPSGEVSLIQLSGKWSKPDGSGALQFSLVEQHVDYGPGARIVSKEIKKDSNNPKYSAYAQYPQIDGGANFVEFNREVERFIKEEMASFEKESADNPYETRDDGGDLQIFYDVVFASKGLISILFNISNYTAGAAHPNHSTWSINYDRVSGKSLALENLFKRGSQYRPAISRLCISKLTEGFGPGDDTDWIKRGAGPDPDNYWSWNITGLSLVITFDPYQVAPYAAGAQTVTIPYTELKNILNPKGPIARLMK